MVRASSARVGAAARVAAKESIAGAWSDTQVLFLCGCAR